MEQTALQDAKQFKTPVIRRMGYGVWLVFGILSIVFYKERVAFMDGAFQLVDLINTEEFSIHHYRLTNPLTQVFAYLGVKLGFPLKYIMIGYSLNFIIFHLLIYHLIIKWCKNDILGLVQVGFFTIFVTQSFYFLPPEFYQGMSILLLWTAILVQPSFKKTKWRIPLLCILLIPIIFDHALLSIFVLFIWFFLWLDNKDSRNYKFYGLFVFMIIVYVVHDLYFTSWYDEARKEHFWRHWHEYYPHFQNIPVHKTFLKRCVDTYYLFPVLLVITIIGYIRAYLTKQSQITSPILKLILSLGFIFFYILINHINDPKTQYLYYSQVNYIGLTIPLLIPICFDFLPESAHKKHIIFIIGAVLLIRIGTIVHTSDVFEKRHKWMLSVIENNESKKNYIDRGDAPKKMLMQVWTAPEETLLLTSIKGPDHSASLLIKRSDYKYISELDSTNFFMRTHSVQQFEELNLKYFNLGEKKYKEAPTLPVD